jgi:hypothetical protein
VTEPAPDLDKASRPTLLSILNNVFFVIVLIALAIGGVFLAVNKL